MPIPMYKVFSHLELLPTAVFYAAVFRCKLSDILSALVLNLTSTWMRTNKLKLNNDKTDLLVPTARHRNQPSIDKIIMGTEDIYPSDSVKNLGCIFDNTLNMKK